MGDHSHFSQADVDDYFFRLGKADETRPLNQREGKATKKMRKAALSFMLNECLDLKINFKKFSAKSTRTSINPHHAYSSKELKHVYEVAKELTEMFALVRLLTDMAARIQDVVGLTFK